MTKKLKAPVIPAKAGIQALDRYRIYANMYLAMKPDVNRGIP
jgi:hypothetical protein